MQSQEGTALNSIREERSPQITHHNVAFDQINPIVSHAADASTLPSTVPESLPGILPLQSESLQLVDSPEEATQELPASEVDNIVANSRSRIDREEPTQFTLNEGDEGHVDLISSLTPVLNGDNDANDDEYDSEQVHHASLGKAPSVASSPHTQTQNPLTQFPESQRFKTPATAGKKRDYLGRTIDTPDLPGPDFRFGNATPAHIIGLSQAFDATQAHTSPVSYAIIHPTSDRPSPTADIEIRPAVATSPAMLPIAEPDTCYVSVAQSQAERQKRASSNLPEDASDDDLSDQPDHLVRRLREKARLERITKTPSSLPSKRRRVSSPVLSPKSPAQLPSNLPELNESEEETDQADENDKDGHDLDHPGPKVDIEDKENDERMAIQIPQTDIRLQRTKQDIPLSSIDSPSYPSDGKLYGSPSPAVANTQLSQPSPRRHPPRKSSPTSDVECVPQSQADPPAPQEQTALSSGPLHKNLQARTEDEAPNPVQLPGQPSDRPHHLGDAIPESSSSKPLPPSLNRVPDSKHSSRSITTTKFETAQSGLQPHGSPRSSISEMSSQPIITGHPTRQRKQMRDISIGPSSQLSSHGFDPVQALRIDNGLQIDLSQTANHAKATTPPNLEPLMVDVFNTRTSPEGQAPTPPEEGIPKGRVPRTDPPHEDTPSSPTPHARPRLGLRRANRSTTKRARANMWDPEVSPEKPVSRPQSPDRAEVHSRPVRLSRRVARRVATIIGDPKDPQCQPGCPNDPSGIKEAPQKAERIEKQVPSASDTSPTTTTSSSTPILTSGSPITATPSHSAKMPPPDSITAPDMVFAVFNGRSRRYYPARFLQKIHSDGGDVRYRVQWDGSAPDEVDEHGIRAIDLDVGDHIKIDMESFDKNTYVVCGFKDKVDEAELGTVMTDIRGFRTVTVMQKQRKSLPASISTGASWDAPIAAVYLDSNMWGQLKHRAHEFRTQLNQLDTPSSGSGTPAKRQVPFSINLSRTRKVAPNMDLVCHSPVPGLFTNMVFAISDDDTNRKHEIVRAIQDNGGSIIRESFVELLQTDSVSLKPEHQNKGFTALLAHSFSRKPKYMQALALGLPCLSGRWILDSVKGDQVVDWQTYLLPAGESDALDGALRSRVLPNLRPQDAKLVDMLQSRPQPLAKMTVGTVIGKSKAAQEKRKPHLFLLHALGAASILKFADVKAAKEYIVAESSSGTSTTSTTSTSTTWLFVNDQDVNEAKAELSVVKTTRKNETKKKHKQKSINKTEHRHGASMTAASSPVCKVAGYELILQIAILGKLYNREGDD